MKSYDNTKIKNIAIAGHAGSGKTTLVEALLYSAGVSDRFGKVADGNTVSDYTAEEIARKCSVYTSLSCYEKDGFKVNLLDTPGLLDFEQSMVEGISACGCCMITVSGKSGVKVGTHKAYNYAKKMGKPAMFVVTKLDDENANFNNIFTELKTEFGPTVCPVVVPVIADRKIVSYVNLIEMKAYKYENGKAVETDMPTAEVSEKMGDPDINESLIKHVADRKGHDLRYAIDPSKIARELGWKPQETFESGIRKTVLWYLEHKDDWCAHVLSGSYKMERLGTGD